MKSYKYHLYYAGCADEDEKIGVAMSDDLEHWIRPTANPIIPRGDSSAFDSEQTSNPCVVQTPDGLTMVYQAKDSSGVFRFGLATSSDGIQWQRSSTPVLEIPLKSDRPHYREGAQHPHLVKLGSGWRLYFVECRGGVHRIRYADSPDLRTFTIADGICIEQQTPWESFAIYYPWIIHSGNEWTMWYSAVESSGVARIWHLMRAVSPDGVTWKRSPAEPIIRGRLPRNSTQQGRVLQRALRRIPFRVADRLVEAGIVPTVNLANPSIHVEKGGKLTMYYHAVLLDGGVTIGRMRSTDGIVWRDREDSILGQRLPGWECDFNADPCLVKLAPPKLHNTTTPEFEAVKRLLDKVPIENGCELWVHSALRRLGGRNAQPRKIVDYLLDRIGPDGTLLMPMFPMAGSAADYIRSGEPFDPRKTPPQMGVLSSVLFEEFPIERSLYPWVSVGAFGKHAREYTATHHLSPWPMSKQSPFYRLYERRGKILLLGVGWERNSNLHVIENLREDAYPYRTFEAGSVEMKYVDPDGRLQPVHVKMPLQRKKTTDWNAWGNTLAGMYGFQQRFSEGELSCSFLDAEGMLNAIERGLDDGIYPYTPTFTPEMRRAWPLIRVATRGRKVIERVTRRIGAWQRPRDHKPL